jgi:hypothetical protein
MKLIMGKIHHGKHYILNNKKRKKHNTNLEHLKEMLSDMSIVTPQSQMGSGMRRRVKKISI